MKKILSILFISLIFNVVNYAETKTAIKPSELNPAIIKDIQTNYPGWIMYEAFKINNRNIITYEVQLRRNQEKINLYYDTSGKFIRKEIPSRKPDIHQKKK